jgi:hypothetical protein
MRTYGRLAALVGDVTEFFCERPDARLPQKESSSLVVSSIPFRQSPIGHVPCALRNTAAEVPCRGVGINCALAKEKAIGRTRAGPATPLTDSLDSALWPMPNVQSRVEL